MATYYVDFGAADDLQNGSTQTLAFKTFSHTFASGDIIWIRRSGTTLTVNPTWTSTPGVKYIGWPVAGDLYFGLMPADPNNWTADAATYPLITCSTATVVTLTASGFEAEFHRLKITNSGNNAGNYPVVVTSSSRFYNCWMEYTSTNVPSSLYVGFAYTSSNQKCLFKSCTITTAQSGSGAVSVSNNIGVFMFVNCTFSATKVSGAAYLVWFNSGITGYETYFINCTFTHSSTSIGATSIIYSSGASYAVYWYFYGCSISIESTSTNTTEITLNTGAAQGTTCYMANMTASKACKHTFPAYSYIHYYQFNQTAASTTYGIDPGQGSFLCGNNFTFVATDTTADIKNYAGTTVMIQNVTYNHEIVQTALQYPGTWQADYGALNAWKHTAPAGSVLSSATITRVGGAAYGLKLQILTGTFGTNPFYKSFNPMLPTVETIFAKLVSGANTVTIYGGYVGYGAVEYYAAANITCPSQEDVWFDMEYYDTAGSTRKIATSRAYAANLTADAGSTWNSDPGFTKFSMAVTVTTGQACLAPIRIYCVAQAAASYVYIDPLPVVT